MGEQNVPVGIYAGYVLVDDRTLEAAIFIGPAETFGETMVQAEAYILDFDEDIYGKEIKIQCIQKTRDHKKFASSEELVAAITQDIIDISLCLQELPKK